MYTAWQASEYNGLYLHSVQYTYNLQLILIREYNLVAQLSEYVTASHQSPLRSRVRALVLNI